MATGIRSSTLREPSRQPRSRTVALLHSGPNIDHMFYSSYRQGVFPADNSVWRCWALVDVVAGAVLRNIGQSGVQEGEPMTSRILRGQPPPKLCTTLACRRLDWAVALIAALDQHRG